MNDNPFSSKIPVGQVHVQLKISDTTPIACPCGGVIFNKGMLLRKVSRILSGGDIDIAPVQGVIYCVKCGKPVPDLLPDEIKQDYIDVEAKIIPTENKSD